tara:strand:+ start:629 stop:1042 length:414 start_codon:yes stop_codon:yes gene_type:complete
MVEGFEEITWLIIVRVFMILCITFVLRVISKKFQYKKNHIYWNWGIGVLTIAPQINQILHIWTDSPSVTLLSLGIYYFLHKYFIEFTKTKVVSKEAVMNNEEALTKLKKSKEKLDLELITQEDYNKIKEELKKYISL